MGRVAQLAVQLVANQFAVAVDDAALTADRGVVVVRFRRLAPST